MSTAVAICTALFALHEPSANVPRFAAMETCVAVYEAAVAADDIDPVEAAAQAGVESRWNPDATDGRGSFGPLQVAPTWFCPGGSLEGCDLIAAGMRARAAWLRAARQQFGRKVQRSDVLCMYWKGYRYTGGGCSYGRTVLYLAKKARKANPFSHPNYLQ